MVKPTSYQRKLEWEYEGTEYWCCVTLLEFKHSVNRVR